MLFMLIYAPMLKSVLKQRLNIQFCILNESSATLLEGVFLKALTEGLFAHESARSSGHTPSDDGDCELIRTLRQTEKKHVAERSGITDKKCGKQRL